MLCGGFKTKVNHLSHLLRTELVRYTIKQIQANEVCPNEKENPADHMTRGLTVDGLCNEIRFWKGSEILKGSETEWQEKELKKQKPAKELRKRQ